MKKKESGTGTGCLLVAGALVIAGFILISDLNRGLSLILAFLVLLVPLIIIVKDSSASDEHASAEAKEDTSSSIKPEGSGSSHTSYDSNVYDSSDDEWVDYQMWDNYNDTGNFF